MAFLLDTNILIHRVRGSALWKAVDERYNLISGQTPSVSTVSVGELQAFSLSNGWGAIKLEKLTSILEELDVLTVDDPDIHDAYAQIQAFSRGKHPTRKRKGSSQTMQHNDIWIAATAHVYGLTLLTADHDFDHLEGLFLNVSFIDANAYR